MKYSLSARQPISVLRNADEIRINYKDRKRIYDFFIEFEEILKQYVIKLDELEIDWEELAKINSLCDNELIVAVRDLDTAKIAKDLGIKWYWGFPITSYWELEGIIAFEPVYVLLGAPLYFDLPKVQKKGVPIRLVANVCYEDYIPRENGVRGTYVRPEDVPVYDKYVDILEFGAVENDIKKEKALFEIYKEGKWPGNLDILLTNFGVFVDNRGIPEQFGEARVQCRQSCMRESHCRLCETIINFVNVVDKNNPKKH